MPQRVARLIAPGEPAPSAMAASIVAERDFLAAADDRVAAGPAPGRDAAPRTAATGAAWNRRWRASSARARATSAAGGGRRRPRRRWRLPPGPPGRRPARSNRRPPARPARWCGSRGRARSRAARAPDRSGGGSPAAAAARWPAGSRSPWSRRRPRGGCRRQRSRQARPRLLDCGQRRAPMHGHPVARQLAQVAQALSQGARPNGRHRRDRSPCPKARAAGGLGHRHYLGAGAPQLAGDLQVERAVACDQDPPAWGHAVAAQQRLRGAGGHHAGQRPARQRQGRARRRRWRRSAARQKDTRALSRPWTATRSGSEAVHTAPCTNRTPAARARAIRLRPPANCASSGKRPVAGCLKYWPPERRPLVDQDHFGARLGGDRGRCEAARTAADHEHLDRLGRRR